MNKDIVLVFAVLIDKITAKWAGTRVLGRDNLFNTEAFLKHFVAKNKLTSKLKSVYYLP